MKDKTIMVSGGFDPLHSGHVRMIVDASQYGRVIVVVNSDKWLMRKKGYVFMPSDERCYILSRLRLVDSVYLLDSNIKFTSHSITTHAYISDDDDTAIDAITKIKPTFFANGGDRTQENVPEQAICDKLGIKMLWGVGGEDKPQSSSWLVNNAMEQLKDAKSNRSN